MNRLAARAASIACTAVVGVAGTAGPAGADSGLCFGVSTVRIVCDPTPDVQVPFGIEPWQTPAPCETDTCQQLVVDAYRPNRGEPFRLCVAWTDEYGHPDGECVDPISISPTAFCKLLRGLHGTYGPVVVTEEGDVYVDTLLVWNCEGGSGGEDPPE